MRLILCDRCKKEIKGPEIDTLYLKDKHGVKEFKAELCLECFHGIMKDVNLTKQEIIDTPVIKMGLSNRAFTCLANGGIKTLKELTEMTSDEIAHIRNLGNKSFQEVIDKMKEYGFQPKEEAEEKRDGRD